MGELKVQGLIVHVPGAWGDNIAAAGATITIYQTSGQDAAREIWHGTTSDDGAYSGKTSEWRRMKTVDLGIGGSYETPDLTDVLNLSYRVTHGTGEANGPFLYLSDLLPSPPIVVSWGPLGGPLARLNGVDCYTVAQVANRCNQAIQTLGSIDIEVGLDSFLPDNQATADFFQAAVDYMIAHQHVASVRAESLDKTLHALRTQAQSIRSHATATRPAQTSGPNLADVLTAKKVQEVSQKRHVWSTIGAVIGIEIAVIVTIVAAIAGLFSAAGSTAAGAVMLVAITCRIVATVVGYSRPFAFSTTAVALCVILLCMMVFVMADKLFLSYARDTVLQNKQGWRINIG